MFKKQVHGMWYNMYDAGGQQRGGGLVAKWCLNLLWLHINFRITCSSSLKNFMGNVIGVILI